MNSSNKNYVSTSLFERANKKNKVVSNGKVFKSQETNDTDYEKVAAWFLGPKAENASYFQNCIDKSISGHKEYRKIYYKEGDPSYIDEDIQSSKPYVSATKKIEEVQNELLDRLKGSAPFFSLRYQAHMNWDTVMPGNIGYFTAMLYNQNNVASEGGPATCMLEKEVGEQLCGLIGFKESSWGDCDFDEKHGKIVPWSHITADGTIANIEAMWAARNLKFYPIAIYNAINANSEDKLKNAYLNLMVITFDSAGNPIKKKFMSCSGWELFNLSCDAILMLSIEINELCNFQKNELSTLISPYLLQNRGLLNYAKEYPEFTNIRVFVPATRHYSWPKAGTLLGLGQDSVRGIPVDDNCHMDISLLEGELEVCLANNIMVLMVVAVVGSTEEGVIDNIEKILKLRETYQKKGLNFLVHCDAAWGGYLRSMMISPDENRDLLMVNESGFVPTLPLSDYAQKQYSCLSQADTVTVDPHKAGFIPYPAGSLSYGNKLLRELITFDAPYIHSAQDLNLGIYGIEGSKPGAAAAAVWMAHKSIPLNTDGYGLILGECAFTNKIYYCYWLVLADDKTNWGDDAKSYDFCIEPLIPLPSKIVLSKSNSIEGKDEMLSFIREYIKNKTNDEIAQNPEALAFLRHIGSDVLINSFVVNFKIDDTWNKSLKVLNNFNNALFNKFSITTPEEAQKNQVDFMLTSSVVDEANYEVPVKRISKNLGFDKDNIGDMTFLINTTLQPWPTTHHFINTIMDCFSKGVIECIKEQEKKSVCSTVETNNEVEKAEDLVEKIPGDSSSKPTRYLELKKSYAGYAKANVSNGNSLFYWFFESSTDCTAETPIIIWLNGGPGASSLAGLFLENGPFQMKDDMTIIPNQNSWNQRAHMLFWDQPVGTGFSTDMPQSYVKTEQEMSYELVNALQDFYSKHPEYRSCPLYITGESYAGKYIPYITKEIHARNNANTQSNIALKGIAIGDGWMEPARHIRDQIDYAYMLGLVDTNQKEISLKLYDDFKEDLNVKDMRKAFDSGNKVSDMLVACGGGENSYDVRTWEDAPIDPLKAYLESPLVKKAIHVPDTVVWAFSDATGPVTEGLMNDLMAPNIEIFPEIVDAKDDKGEPLYKVLFYTGNFDMSCGFSGTEEILRNMQWHNSEEWKELQRLVWYKVDENNKKQANGCIKSLNNLMQIEIPMSGHQVPLYQPVVAIEMIYNWIFNEGFLTYNPLSKDM